MQVSGWTGLILGVVLVGGPPLTPAGEAPRRSLEYAPAPVDNPLKGLVPYAGDRRDAFPHSLEFNYLPLAALVIGPDQYDWGPLETLLDEIAGRGHQAVFRIYLEYPGRTNVIPEFLVKDGLKVHTYINTNTQPLPPRPVETPNYEDPRLRKMLRGFIAALGEKYDGDPRIGYITAGLLGTWGEWHTYPREELFASKIVQIEVMDAYEAAFRETPVLLRYPAGADDSYYAPNAARRFGYHDDSFAWATLETGRRADSWFFMALLREAGPEALEAWKSRPIGGEIRPEAWGRVFDEDPGRPEIQDFRECVEATHVTWLMDTGMFRRNQPQGRRERAEAMVRRLGYEFHVTEAACARSDGNLDVTIALENRGVAPFYREWPAEMGLLDEAGSLVRKGPVNGRLTGLLPGDPARTWTARMPLDGLDPGSYKVVLRVPNPLPNGLPVRFANTTQDQNAPGWLTLDVIAIP